MEVTNTPAPEAAPVTDNAAPDVEAVSTDTAKPTEAKADVKDSKESKAAGNSDEKAYRLKELIEITERNPDKKLSAEDQAIYEEWVDNKIQPKDRPEAKEKPVEKVEKPEKVEKVDKPEISPAIEAAMKKVGAKTPEEIEAKIDGLKALASGKESEAVKAAKAELTRAAESEAALWRDFMDGKPEALQFVEKAYGLKPKTQTQQAQPTDFDPDTLAEADALTGGITSKVIAQNRALQERLDAFEAKFTGHQKEIQTQQIKQSVAAELVDDMIALSQHMEGVKDIPNLRNVIIDRVVNGKQDSRLDVFNEIFSLAQELNVSPRLAYDIKKGRDAALLIEQAREQGRKEAYQHKPNRSLSSIQTEDAEPQTITDSQLKAMEKDPRAIPDNWIDKNGDLDFAKIPKKAWAIFGRES